MSKQQIKKLIEQRTQSEGLVDSGVKGVQLFRVSEPVRCAPAIYQPSIVAIVSGTKEAILDGQRYEYGSDKYMCCPMSMPVEAGTPRASAETPLLGVYISLDTRVMTELAIELERVSPAIRPPTSNPPPHGLTLADWDNAFTEALLRLLQISSSATDASVLGNGRMRELYYAVLNGEAGRAPRRAFGVGNEIARTIDYLSTRLHEPVTIDAMAAQVGMSRAVFHRKFKQATTMSPIQFVKSMRLNNAAMRIATGMTVNEAAMEVGYLSSSQFSREFKRMYGHSPRKWSHTAQLTSGVA